ncbi:MAG: hypothetical protein KQA35_04530 [Candidatus Aenigmarchaeota archaeon]|nr:hypothetical protein [Candidatus Aenigmarchaeota archaeon]
MSENASTDSSQENYRYAIVYFDGNPSKEEIDSDKFFVWRLELEQMVKAIADKVRQKGYDIKNTPEVVLPEMCREYAENEAERLQATYMYIRQKGYCNCRVKFATNIGTLEMYIKVPYYEATFYCG